MDLFVVIFELCVASPQLKFLTVGYFGLYLSLGKMLYFVSMEIPESPVYFLLCRKDLMFFFLK